jgi:serine/threonine-protein kinase HipA
MGYHERGTIFQYDEAFIAGGFNLSPLVLDWDAEPKFFQDPALSSLPGIIADCLPDTFGTRIMERYFRRNNLPQPRQFEKLAYVGNQGIGALSFRPVIPHARLGQEVQLAKLSEEIHLLDPDDSLRVDELLRETTSVGGAQPKALLSRDPRTGKYYSGHEDRPGLEHLLIKFQRDPEMSDESTVEHAFAELAKACGIDAVRSLVIEDEGTQGRLKHYAAYRYDILPDGSRVHYASFNGLMEGHYFEALNPDYEHLIRAAKILCSDYSASVEMFRRAAFNVVVNNQDDHQKNHGFLFDGRDWKPSPAFDLTYSLASEASPRAMPLAGASSRVSSEDLRRLAEKGGLQTRDAREACEQIAEGMKAWPTLAEAAGVSGPRMSEIQEVIAANLRRVVSS